MAPQYGWILDVDTIYDPVTDEGGPAVGLVGPRLIHPEIEQLLREGHGDRFRMLDDDGMVYYEGRIAGRDTNHFMFAPLDDFGRPNAGCTTIEYQHPVSKGWEPL